ncbi:DUF2953 domain-containing protein [Paraliobacillus zengyii]|uniref:DUF2953 domain-containing protein n=2 Tax=Paraliobacillus zengyii TaxID=2213194 RepID=UPI000DD3DF09|nr:DUF2953 domain-containing protein [Paraliobacillus zengyii]
MYAIILIFLLILLILLLLVMCLSIKVKLYLECSQEIMTATIIIHVAGIKMHERAYEIVLKDVFEEEAMDLIESIQTFFNQSQEKVKPQIKLYRKNQKFHKLIRARLKKVNMHSLNWETTIGTAEATSTGLLAGLCWTVKGCIGAVLDQFVNIKESPEFKVTPVFQQRLVNSNCTCIFSMRLGQAIYTMMQVGKWNSK